LYNKAENIVGWFPIKTEGRVISMTTVARPDGKDDLFICVERGMQYDENGEKTKEGVYYIERLSDEPEFSEFDETIETKKEFHRRQLKELSKVNFLDCSVTLKGEKLSVNAIIYKDHFVIVKTIYPNVVEKLKEGMTVRLVQRFYQNNILKQHEQTVLIKRIEEDDADRVYYYIDGEFEHTNRASEIYLPINAVGDLDDCEGQYQSVFADGGYVGTYLVENGKIVLDKSFTTITIGYPYTGIAKTFNIGSWYDGFNSQTAKKRVVSMVVRFLNSASFKIGTALSNLQPMQEFKPDGFYDSAPVLMDGDVTINGYNDTHDKEKCLYFVQDEPTPCNIAMVDCNVSFSKMG
jgi:hypothetical protein